MTHHTDGEEPDMRAEFWNALMRAVDDGLITHDEALETYRYKYQPVEAAPHGKTRTKTKDR